MSLERVPCAPNRTDEAVGHLSASSSAVLKAGGRSSTCGRSTGIHCHRLADVLVELRTSFPGFDQPSLFHPPVC